MIRRTCNYCDKYYTPKAEDPRPDMCPACVKEFHIVKSDLAERTLKTLHEKFK